MNEYVFFAMFIKRESISVYTYIYIVYIHTCVYTYIIRRSPRSSADASVQVLSVTKCRMHGTTQDEVRCRQQQRMAIVKLFSCLLMQGQRYLAAMVVQW